MPGKLHRYVPCAKEDGTKFILDVRLGSKAMSFEEAAIWLNIEYEDRVIAQQELAEERKRKPRTTRTIVDLRQRRRRATA